MWENKGRKDYQNKKNYIVARVKIGKENCIKGKLEKVQIEGDNLEKGHKERLMIKTR